jgi:hypothetical protein
MQIRAEADIRARTAAIPLEWATEAEGSFAGESKAEFGVVITAAHIVADEAGASLRRWIDAGRRAGLSWGEVGALLGISKQAAQQRFGRPDDGNAQAGDGETVVRLGATAFNEMFMLRTAGEKGQELVRTGVLSLTFRQTDSRWEYQRLIGLSPAPLVETMGRAGWSHVSSWVPFHYFKRRLAEG